MSEFLLSDSFVLGLDRKDLVRLRHLTRKNAGGFPLTDEQCDIIIDEIGPHAALDTLKRAVDGSLID